MRVLQLFFPLLLVGCLLTLNGCSSDDGASTGEKDSSQDTPSSNETSGEETAGTDADKPVDDVAAPAGDVPQGAKAFLAYVLPDFAGAFIVHPKRLAESDLVSKLEVEELLNQSVPMPVPLRAVERRSMPKQLQARQPR